MLKPKTAYVDDIDAFGEVITTQPVQLMQVGQKGLNVLPTWELHIFTRRTTFAELETIASRRLEGS